MNMECKVRASDGWTDEEKRLLGVPGCQQSQEALGMKDATPMCLSPKTLGSIIDKLDAYEEKHFGHVLPTSSAERKTFPMYEGLLKYFPDALAAVSHLSWVGNEQHNPGEPLHWAKEKSTDHADCILRHLVDALQAAEISVTEKELTAVAWRALALLQTFYDQRKAQK